MSYPTGRLIQRTPVFRLESVSSGSGLTAVDICHQMEYSTPTPPTSVFLPKPVELECQKITQDIFVLEVKNEKLSLLGGNNNNNNNNKEDL